MNELEIEQRDDLAWALQTLSERPCMSDDRLTAVGMLHTLTFRGVSDEIRSRSSQVLAQYELSL